jgi:hypothetical protein
VGKQNTEQASDYYKQANQQQQRAAAEEHPQD